MRTEFRKAAEIITKLFDGLNSEEINQVNLFIRSWKEIVGEKIASHSKVIDVDKGMLIVEVDHPGWSQQIQFIKKNILKSLSYQFPQLNIRNIAIRVVSECTSTYVRQDEIIGGGITRVDESISNVSVNDNFDGELKTVLENLKKSIQKGKMK